MIPLDAIHLTFVVGYVAYNEAVPIQDAKLNVKLGWPYFTGT